MPNPVRPVPECVHSVTPNLVCRDAARAIDYYKNVFGATENVRMSSPDGKVMHAELKIGDSTIFVNDTMSKTVPAGPEPGTSNLTILHLYVPDVDTVFNRAVTGGARVEMPVQDMFWGDRYGKLTDPFGQNGASRPTRKTSLQKKWPGDRRHFLLGARDRGRNRPVHEAG